VIVETPYGPFDSKYLRLLKVLGFAILFLLFIGFEILSSNLHHLNNLKKEEYQIVVSKKYEDDNNKGEKTICDAKGICIGVSVFHDCFNYTEIGDTLVKEKGSLKVLLKKKDTSYAFYPNDTVSIW